LCRDNKKQSRIDLLKNTMQYSNTPASQMPSECKPRYFKALLEIYNIYLTDNFFEVLQGKAKSAKIKIKKKEPLKTIEDWFNFSSYNFFERKKLREIFCRTKKEYKELTDKETKGACEGIGIFSKVYKSPMDQFNEAYSTFIETAIKMKGADWIKQYFDLPIEDSKGEPDVDRLKKIKELFTLQPLFNCYPPDSLIKTDYLWMSQECVTTGVYALPLLKDAMEIPNEKIPSDHYCIAAEILIE
jgi:hypothetical protein